MKIPASIIPILTKWTQFTHIDYMANWLLGSTLMKAIAVKVEGREIPVYIRPDKIDGDTVYHPIRIDKEVYKKAWMKAAAANQSEVDITEIVNKGECEPFTRLDAMLSLKDPLRSVTSVALSIEDLQDIAQAVQSVSGQDGVVILDFVDDHGWKKVRFRSTNRQVQGCVREAEHSDDEVTSDERSLVKTF